jgi:hypothetical protein
LLYILSFALGAGPVTGLIIPELNNAQIRGAVMMGDSAAAGPWHPGLVPVNITLCWASWMQVVQLLLL